MVSSVLVELDKYLVDHSISFLPTVEEQNDAIQCVLNSKNFNILPIVCSLFKVSGNEDHIKKIVNKLVEHEKLIEAAYCVGALNLQHEYEIEKIVIPLLLNGKMQPAAACLKGYPDLQLKVAKILDGILEVGSKNESKRAKNALDVFLKLFKVSPEDCTNLFFIRGRSAINHLIKRRSQQSVTQKTFEEMIMSILKDNPALKKHLIYKLVQVNDKELALKMMEKLNVTDFDFSSVPLKEELVSLEGIDEGDEKSEATHLSFPLDLDDIKFVDNEESFNCFIDDIKTNYKILGIDCEWKPHFGLSKDRLSLIQLAVHDKVYIVDAVQLSEYLSADNWDSLNEDIFGNPDIVKIGCDMLSDIQMIVNNNKGTTGKKIRFSHILDIVLFYEKLRTIYPEHMKAEPQPDYSNTLGLSKLCEAVLGQPLNKEERLCDWEKRPLSEAQLEYAALDAYCLLQIYDKLKEIAVESNMNFELHAKNSMVQTASQCKPKKGVNELKNAKAAKFRKRTSIQNFKVAVDSELKQQGERLKKLGADVLFLCKSNTPEEIAKISQNEFRVVLCSEPLHDSLQSKMSPWLCFKSPTNIDDYITVSNLLQRFNVYLPQSTASSCIVCSNKDILQLSTAHLKLLQGYIENKTLSEQDNTDHNFHRTLTSLKESGIVVKFYNPIASSLSESSYKHFCTKCGTIQ